MPFEVIHTPGELPGFDFAGAYFDTARKAEDRQRAQDQSLGLSLLRLAGQREGIRAANDRAAASIDAANKRAANRLAFDREKQNAEMADLQGMTEAAYGGLGLEPDQPTDPTDELANELGTGPEDDGPDAEPDQDPDDNAARVHPGYGVPARLNRLPKTKAGYTILWNAIKAAQAQQKQAAEKAAKATRAGQLQQALGVGLPVPATKREATPEEGGYLLADPTVEDPGSPGMTFTDPGDVVNVAKLKQSQDRIQLAQQRMEALEQRVRGGGKYTEAEVAQHAQNLMTIRPDLSPAVATALARERLAKIPVGIDNVKALSPTETEDYKQLLHDRNTTYTAVRRLQSDPLGASSQELKDLKAELADMDRQLEQIRRSGGQKSATGTGGKGEDDTPLIDQALKELGPDASDEDIEARVLKLKGARTKPK